MRGILLALAGPAAAFTPAGVPARLLEEAGMIQTFDTGFKPESSHIKSYNFSVPIDHFHNDSRYEPHTDDTYNLRYWLDASNYRPGGPVIVLHAGEFTSEGRVPFLDHGIVPILTKPHGGVGIVLEHRYYGTSHPFNQLTTENLRFLSVEQALADNAYFAKNIKFPGLEHLNLTAPGTPWIMYGGSYAGAIAALTRKVYPDVYWGGISSSGVPQAIDEYWQYLLDVKDFYPKGCIDATEKFVDILDHTLFSGNEKEIHQLKKLFHLDGLQNDEFGLTVGSGLMGLQSTNWDVEEESPKLAQYCAVITSDAMLYGSTAHLVKPVQHFLSAAGYNGDDKLQAQFLNWVGYTRHRVKADYQGACKGLSKAECYSNRKRANSPDISSSFQRSWDWQTCTEYGFFMTGAGTPKHLKALVSRAVTRDYAAWPCKHHFNLTQPPNLDAINKYGGFNFSHSRLAFIDGKQDPWRAASPHADSQPWQSRKSTTSEPFILIDWGVHHWDEYGVREGAEEEGLPPPQVADAQQQMVHFVGEWLKEFKVEKAEQETRKSKLDNGWESIELR